LYAKEASFSQLLYSNYPVYFLITQFLTLNPFKTNRK